jgi:hypothetical protein
MTFSLYAATVPSYLQMTGAIMGLIDKAEVWCAEKGMAEADLLGRRLAADMHPLAYQVKSVAVHSAGAIEGVRRGAFSPHTEPPPETFALLRARLTEASAVLTSVDPAEMDGFVGRDMAFVVGEHRIAFTAEDFLMSFAQPNFYFHCTTAYAILRAEGLAIGKRDFLGQQRRKPRA